MPRGARLHGITANPHEDKAEASSHELIDRMVEVAGVDAVRQMSIIKDHKAHRDYMDEKYPLKEICQ